MAKKRKSRLERIERSRARRSAVLYILLSIFAVFLLLRYGITAVSHVAEFVNDTVGSSNGAISTGSLVPPAPPRLDDLPSYTNRNKLTVKGDTVAGYDVNIYINGEKFEVISNAQGEFSVSVPISTSEINTIYAVTRSPSGLESKDSERYNVVYDDEPPELEIISPGDEVFGETNRQINIEGQTDPDAQIRINERIVIVRSDGKFDYRVRLENGENIFNIKSIDEAGNEVEIEKKINFIL